MLPAATCTEWLPQHHPFRDKDCSKLQQEAGQPGFHTRGKQVRNGLYLQWSLVRQACLVSSSNRGMWGCKLDRLAEDSLEQAKTPKQCSSRNLQPSLCLKSLCFMLQQMAELLKNQLDAKQAGRVHDCWLCQIRVQPCKPETCTPMQHLLADMISVQDAYSKLTKFYG